MDAAKAGLAATLLLVLGACTPHAAGQTAGSTPTNRSDRRFAAFAYPRATPDGPGTFTSVTAEGRRTIAGFTTSDAFARVYAFYQRMLPAGSETMHVINPNGSVATFEIDPPQSRETVSVQISSDKPNATEILITQFQPRR